jgi:hypothetical protein
MVYHHELFKRDWNYAMVYHHESIQNGIGIESG